MELLFVFVIGAGIGAIVRYLIPRRGTYGMFLLPAIAAAVAGVVWVSTLWGFRWTFDGTWIWVASLGLAFLASLAAAMVIPRRRVTADDRLLDRLSGGKA